MDDQSHPDVILLAAGMGKRMLPLTEQTPKPLIKVDGYALIDRVAANCIKEGCSQFAINIHHHMDQMREHVEKMMHDYPKVGFFVSEEHEAPLETGGGAKKALALTHTDPVLITNSDSFWLSENDKPIGRMIDQFVKSATIVLLCAHPARSTGFRRSHDFCLAPDKRITNDRGVPIIYAGTALISRALLEMAPTGVFSLFDLFIQAQERGTLHGVLLDAPWFHVGDPKAIAEVEAALAGEQA